MVKCAVEVPVERVTKEPLLDYVLHHGWIVEEILRVFIFEFPDVEQFRYGHDAHYYRKREGDTDADIIHYDLMMPVYECDT